MNVSASSSTAFAKCTPQCVYQQGTVLMRYMSCHEEMCQLTHDVENIIYRKMVVVKGSNTDPQNFSVVHTKTDFSVLNTPTQKDVIF